jgi:hypothetical protein
MSKKKTKSRRSTRKRTDKRRSERLLIPIFAIIAGGLLIIAAGWYLLGNKSNVDTAFAYNPDDVVYDQPLYAIHEMEPPSLASVPYLPKDSPQPKIAVSEDFYSFGSIAPTDVVTHEFIIANVGDAPLTINRAYTTCGCTTADISASVIPPGKFSVVALRLDAGFHDVRGQTVRRGLIIENNDRSNPQLEIWTQASVRNNP